jgi:diacylglycerol kinase (ATP)
MADRGDTGIKRVIRAGGYSWKGFVAAFRNEAAFRQELALTVLLLPLAFWLGDNALERALLIAVWLLVPTVELLNSGIEAVVDRISAERHPLAGRAKDVGSAAVFLAFSNAAIVWAVILFTE